MVVATFAIYISAGKVVLQWRRQLLKFTQNNISTYGSSSPGIAKTVEVHETTEPAQIPSSTQPPGFASRQISVSHEPNPPSSSARYDRRPRKSIPSSAANKAAINYCKCALLFFIAMLVTWVPSTLNRLIELANPKESIFALNYASSMVLPLQGFWNAIIYIFTSLPASKALVRKIMTALHIGQMPRWRNGQFSTTDRPGSKNQPVDCSESVRELHPNRGDGLGMEMK
jgi:hypothetical protein